jgi:hypothetical protein
MTTHSLYTTHSTQNHLLLQHLMEFYSNRDHLNHMMRIINGESNISLRIVDWFVTNYAKKHYTVYDLPMTDTNEIVRFKVYNDYKLKLKAYSKKRFDPFCRWERIQVPYDDEKYMETTIGQLNFFKWAIEHRIVDYIMDNYTAIEYDMNHRNSSSLKRLSGDLMENTGHAENAELSSQMFSGNKTRKRREELSISACKCIKKENVNIVVKFN